MPQQTKIFRVFISSTFSDMKLERGILQRDAFPRLEKFCEGKGAKFQAVDLRWGINDESSLNQKTLQICFNEIARCQKISPKPNFLILLGDKYGWQPIPEIIPEEELIAILGILDRNDKELIEKWYKLDKNAAPFDNRNIHEYVLQPKLNALELKDPGQFENQDLKTLRDAWETIAKLIRKILRDAVEKLNMSPEQKIYYNASATHQEIIRGALNPPKESESPEKHVFAFSRSIAGLPDDKTAGGFIDLVNGEPDKESKIKLDNLKKELSEKLGNNHFKTYSGIWENGTLFINEGDLKEFNDKVYSELENVISSQITDVVDKEGFTYETKLNELEIKLHEEFKIRLTEHFKGRDNIIDTINEYLSNMQEKRVMSIIGASGSGKSSIMAQAVKLIENTNIVLVYRFIGTTSQSSNIMSLLQSLCGQIANKFGIEDAKTLGSDEKAWYDMNGLADIFRKCLALATSEKPILLFIDSLDQLSETDNAKALYWLPEELPDHVHLIVSTLQELEGRLKATFMLQVPALPEKEAIDILDLWLRSEKRKLTDVQHDLVIKSFNSSPFPLYLKLAFEKAKKWHSYDNNHSLKPDVKGIINEYFDDLEKEFPEDFVKTAICYMLSGRYMGLAENEILEIMAFDQEYWQKFIETTHKEHRQELETLKFKLENPSEGPRGYMKIPIAVWSRLYLELEPFLTERDADGVPIITFFHRQFNEVLQERYGLVEIEKMN
jgi:energy-coupling factor transporter ATP-binding protein EcfA2